MSLSFGRPLLFAFLLYWTNGLALYAQTQPEPAVEIPKLHQSIVITATPIDPALDRRNQKAFEETLFSRDDQVFHLLDAGINAGQHEGGGKSLEIRRFGFNLDHGGVNGGLKVLIDDVPQNQSTQGHGQGYLGALKSMTPELIQEVTVHNGPFRAEYGDFSGLGVVHIQMREALPDEFTARAQAGSFGAKRGFFAWSPKATTTDAIVAYEGSFSDGPFLKPLGYRRDNVTGNYTRRLSGSRALGFKWNAARNEFSSSGQLPLDLVYGGQLDRFGSLDPGDGGDVQSGTLGAYYRHELADRSVFKIDGFVSRMLFDLYSNFTFALNDPINGDGIQQHDSRLQQGVNAQYLRPHRGHGISGLLTAGGNFHGNQNLVGLFSRVNRSPFAINTLAHANVNNGAGYVQESLSFLEGRIQAGGGFRYDVFRFQVDDKVDPTLSGSHSAGRVQPKANFAYTPSLRVPLTFSFNYGRGISSLDARGVVTQPDGQHLATTDFVQAGLSYSLSRFSFLADWFDIHRSNELVYIPDDGSLEFLGRSRAYGVEAKTSVAVTQSLSFNAGMTKVLDAFYKDTEPREYVDRAPHFVANAGLTLADWHGWSGSLRLRAINHYRLDPLDPTLRATGHTVIDLGISRPIRRGVEFNIAVDNLTDRAYFETQNYFESRLPGQEPMERIHATPGYPINLTVGLTFRFRRK